MFMVAMLGL